MSIRLMLNVVKQSKRKPSEKLMLIILAEFANDNAECFPSFETLASLCNVSTRQAQNIIYTLIKEGEITVSRREGGSNLYRILNHLKPATHETYCVGTPTKFSANGHQISTDTHEISDITHETHFVPTPTKFSATHEVDFVSDAIQEEPQKPTTHEMDFVPPTKFSTPTHETHFVPPTKPISSEPVIEPNTEPKEIKSIKNNVTPVGGDTAQTHLVEPTPQPTQSGETSVSQSSDQTGMTDQPPTPVIEGIATNSDTTKLNSMPSSQNTPPVVPPADSPKVRTLSDHQRMVSEIAKAFGWDFATMTKSNKKLVGKVASELREAGATPDDIPTLYEYCQNQGWTGKFTPMALSSQWASFVAQKGASSASKDYLVDETGMIWRTYVPPPDYKPMFDYDEMNRKFRESVGEIPTPSDEEVEKMTPEERTKNIKAMISEWAKKMEVPVMELDPDDPMNEVLKW